MGFLGHGYKFDWEQKKKKNQKLEGKNNFTDWILS